MDISLVDLVIETISGAVGGYIVGTAIRDLSLGTVGNLIAGVSGDEIADFFARMFPGIPLFLDQVDGTHAIGCVAD